MLNKTLMMKLSLIAYSDSQLIADQVSAYDSDLSVVWGPAWSSTGSATPYSLAFIVHSASTGAYTVVIRGTDPWSLTTWLEQDFDIHTTVPFTTFVKDAPSSALLSQGAANGLSYLLALVPNHAPEKGTMAAFLGGEEGLASVSVTGHSLGGTLTAPLFAALSGAFADLPSPPSLDLMSFAGLTPGNRAFADYVDALAPTQSWRVVNPLDIAPQFFASYDAAVGIYGAELPCPLGDAAILALLFASAGTDYVQPGASPTVLPRAFNKKLPSAAADKEWADQALYQHHASTYWTLVTQGE